MASGLLGSTTVRGLQERAARALPAARVERRGGWWLRHAPGCSWWVGTVLPHGGADDDPGDLERRVVEAEEFAAARGAAACFQITPTACPAALDGLLAERGYARSAGSMSLRAAPTAHVRAAIPAPPAPVSDSTVSRRAHVEGAPPAVRVADRPGDDWFAVWPSVLGAEAGPRAEPPPHYSLGYWLA
ncbi:hypothetical protein LG943_26335 [Streptomonospora sp. S1-112]|uniref:Uncharacterized protein n=1 Tax=Streptomonospora mangrovi TaxID=2883123 RepID=A0A9X3NQ41_9ACTN|nr:hypothetical protein [Streptomonospora mangrovi]MDA0567814.1 hypothetical protein [Streptomonospora mangrovi]